jgi:N-formylmaleamate deformylase
MVSDEFCYPRRKLHGLVNGIKPEIDGDQLSSDCNASAWLFLTPSHVFMCDLHVSAFAVKFIEFAMDFYDDRKQQMAQWASAICETNGIKIHYTRTGGDKPPLILLHGLAADGLCWTHLARALEREYDVIMPDARGHGKSSVPDYGYRYEDLANDVVGLIEALRLSAPIAVGHSMGGMTATVVASRKPGLLRSLILAEPTFLSPKVLREVRDSDVAKQHRRLLNKSLDELIAELRIKHPHRSLDMLELIARARLQTSMAAFDVLTPPNPDYKKLVSSIDVPTLLVLGENGVVSPVVAEELRRLNPKLRVEQIGGAGHGIQYDQPERFANVVKSFLFSIGKASERERV